MEIIVKFNNLHLSDILYYQDIEETMAEMGYKQLYTNAEWDTLQTSVIWLIRAIARADGRVDPHEIKAMQIISKLAPNFRCPLAKEVLMSVDKQILQASNRLNLSVNQMNNKLCELADILCDKAPKKVALDFKKTMLAIALFIANASGKPDAEDGNIDETEAELIVEIIKLLDISDEDLNTSPTLDEMASNFKQFLAF